MLLLALESSAQSMCVELSASEVERLFVEQNLEVLAEKMNISLADASILQAKLWDNPTVSVNGLNLWSSKEQRNGENIPPLFGNFGRNLQFSVELSQMIKISGERAKLISMEKSSREITIKEFEQTLRGLKLELRKLTSNMVFLQSYKDILIRQSEVLNELSNSFKKQYRDGALSKNEVVRVQSALLEIDGELSSTEIELNSCQSRLKTLLSTKEDIYITITTKSDELTDPDSMDVLMLIGSALENRADVNIKRKESEYHKKSIAYERAKRIPGLDLSIGYDRRGGVWRDFVGFGVGIDLPLFNRNQAAIKSAKISHQRSESLSQQLDIIVHNEVYEAFANYKNVYRLYKESLERMAISDLDDMLKLYTRNLIARNVSMLEYMDFLERYKSTMQIASAIKRDASLLFNELEYVSGTYINRSDK